MRRQRLSRLSCLSFPPQALVYRVVLIKLSSGVLEMHIGYSVLGLDSCLNIHLG